MGDDEPATEPDRAWPERAQTTPDPRAAPEDDTDDCKRD